MIEDKLPLATICALLLGILFLFLGKVFVLFSITSFIAAAALGVLWWRFTE